MKDDSILRVAPHKGDDGTTSLFGNVRVHKDDTALEVCGHIDELSAVLGIARTEKLPEQLEHIIIRIQRELIAFCNEIVSNRPMILPEHIKQIESDIECIESELPTLTRFIIPGNHRGAAMLHLARTVCRRAERSLTTLCRTQARPPHLTAYLNRLGTLLFVTARKAEEC